MADFLKLGFKNTMIIEKKHSCFIFGEGRKDINFITALIDHPKFRFHTQKWIFSYDNASGSSPEVIAKQCRKLTRQLEYDLILCFIDLDKLKQDFPKNWSKKQKALEDKYDEIVFIWQIDNAEDEYKKVIGNQRAKKHKLNELAKMKIEKFINSDLWKRIQKPIKNKEKVLEEMNAE